MTADRGQQKAERRSEPPVVAAPPRAPYARCCGDMVERDWAEDMAARIKSVLDIHARIGDTCIHCCDANAKPMRWPCPTVRLLCPDRAWL